MLPHHACVKYVSVRQAGFFVSLNSIRLLSPLSSWNKGRSESLCVLTRAEMQNLRIVGWRSFHGKTRLRE